MNSVFLTAAPGADAFDRAKTGAVEGVAVWDGAAKRASAGTSWFGYVISGSTHVTMRGSSHNLGPGCYFSASGELELEGGHGILIEVPRYDCLDTVGGPIEPKGRLKYIDGCMDTLLIPPVRLGDPCLNALYFPPGVTQSLHTHPSVRFGVVVSGKGVCETPTGMKDLEPGLVFCIVPEGLHGFRTQTDSGMVVVAYHPDSDYGPMDEDHPMINRTMIDGVSASEIAAIRTS